MLKFAIVGFGGLAKLHYGNVEKVQKAHNDIKLVALCDVDPDAFKSQAELNIGSTNLNLDFTGLNIYNSAEELFEKEELDFIITAIPTFEHARIAVMALNKGIHVFSEKPMARTLDQAKEMIDAAKKNNKTLMIGQCVRYFPEYVYAKELMDEGKYGKVVRANFSRLSAFPQWCWQQWYSKEEWSGGAALDLHVHDVDFISYAFGRPKSVSSTVTNLEHTHDSIVTNYEYDDKTVVATGDWSLPTGFTFSAEFMIHFENAALELKDGVLTLYKNDKTKETITVEPKDGYVEEVVDFITCIKEGRWSTINNPDTAYQSLEIALAEKLSGDKKEKVVL